MVNLQVAKNDYMMKTKQFIVKSIHFSLALILFFFTFLLFRYETISGIQDVGFRYNYIVTAGFGVLVAFFNRTYNSYLFGYCRIRTLAFAQFLSQFFSLVIVFLSALDGISGKRPGCLSFFCLSLPYLTLVFHSSATGIISN